MSIKTYKHKVYPILGMLLITACREEMDLPSAPDANLSPIELSVGLADESSATRAVITDGENKTKSAFSALTSLYMVMRSDDISGGANPSKYTRTVAFAESSDTDKSPVVHTSTNEFAKFVRYWEDAHSRNSALSVFAVCTPGIGPGKEANKKAWLIDSNSNYANFAWNSTIPTSYATINWPVTNAYQFTATDQSTLFEGLDFIQNQDLCFSNNISKYTKGDTETDARMKFDFDDTHAFEHGNMIFYHALSKLTFQIKKGDGFTDDEFTFDDYTNIKLSNFYNSGTFDIEKGEFLQNTLTKVNIEKIYQHPSLTQAEKNAGYNKILDALVIPGTDMSTSDLAVTFSIHGNEYKLSRQMLLNAFTEADRKATFTDGTAKYFDSEKILKAGVHYIITLTVGKTQIKNITAQLVPWEEVSAINFSPDNAHITLNLLVKDKEELKEGVDFYRGLNLYPESDFNHDWKSYDWQHYDWTTSVAYEKANATFVESADGEGYGHWTTEWFWDSNRHFYHFRAILPSGHEINNNDTETSDPVDPTVNLAAARIEKGVDGEGNPVVTSTYTDVKWGAPFLNTTQKLTYSTSKGFDGKGAEAVEESEQKHQIYWAIGPTKDEIKLISFHLMSEITINLTTSEDGKADRVLFGDGSDAANSTLIELRNCAATATANVGDGCVNPGSPVTTQILASDLSANNTQLQWGVIPQSLEGAELRIVTPDGNEYLVALANIEATYSGVEKFNPTVDHLANPYTVVNGKFMVDAWYPNYRYTYNFKLTKMGIADLKATIIDWESVVADEQEVQIQ